MITTVSNKKTHEAEATLTPKKVIKPENNIGFLE
jgi:hypothetical protein